MTVRSSLYRLARLLGDVDAARKGPSSYARRAGRKAAYRTSSRATRRLLRGLGL